jgi:hypothetical protein
LELNLNLVSYIKLQNNIFNQKPLETPPQTAEKSPEEAEKSPEEKEEEKVSEEAEAAKNSKKEFTHREQILQMEAKRVAKLSQTEKMELMNKAMARYRVLHLQPKQAYEKKLRDLVKHNKEYALELYIEFFIPMLNASPELLFFAIPEYFNRYDLFGATVKIGYAPLFKQFNDDFIQIEGDRLFSNKDHEDYLVIAMENTCLQFVTFAIKRYGIEAVHKSMLDEELNLFIAKNPNLVIQLMNDTEYKPKIGTDLNAGILALAEKSDPTSFIEQSKLKNHITDYPKIFEIAVNRGYLDCMDLCYKSGKIETSSPKTFRFLPYFFSFLKREKAGDVLSRLTTYGFEPYDINKLSALELLELINIGEISIETAKKSKTAKLGCNELTRFLQLDAATNYKKEIQEEKEFFWGEKHTRLKACDALIEYNQNGTCILESHREALSQSPLSDIVALQPVQYEPVVSMHFGTWL